MRPQDSSDDDSQDTSASPVSTCTTEPTDMSDSELEGFALDLTIKAKPMEGAYRNDRGLEDLPVVKHALALFLASHMVESEQYLLGCDSKKYVYHVHLS